MNSKWSMYQTLSSCLSLSLSSVLVWDGATLERRMFSFLLLLFCFLIPCCLCVSFVPYRAITLDNQLVVLATTAADAGRYHVEAVNEMTGECVTSPAVYLSIAGRKTTPLINMVYIQQVRISWVYTEWNHAAYLHFTKKKSLFPNQIWLIMDYKIFRLFEKLLLDHYLILFHLFVGFWGSVIGLSVLNESSLLKK